MTDKPNLARLLDGVPRYVQVNGSLHPTEGQHGLMRSDEVLAALAAAPPMGVKVKPLMWRDIGPAPITRAANTMFGLCMVLDHGTEWRIRTEASGDFLRGEEGAPLCYTTPDAAKDAAQADYEARILASLSAALPADVAGVVEEAGKVLEGVTPGPWDVRKWSQKMTITGNIHQVTDKDGYPSAFVPAWDAPGPGGIDGTEEAKANARFIAWCREGVPALIALATAQAAQIAGLEQKVNGLCDLYSQASDQVQSAGAALAAERAKTARLVDAGKLARRWVDLDDDPEGPLLTRQGVFNALDAALSEAEART